MIRQEKPLHPGADANRRTLHRLKHAQCESPYRRSHYERRLGPALHDLHPDREVAFEGGRLDFRLGSQDEDHFVEVKSVTWMEGKGLADFPTQSRNGRLSTWLT